MKTACALLLLAPFLAHAADPLSWYEVETVRTPSIITYGNGTWLGLFEDGRYSSTNGFNWTKRSENQSSLKPLFLRDEFYYLDSTVVASPNGWSNFRVLGSPSGQGLIPAFIFGNDQFYAARETGISISADGKTWTWNPIGQLNSRIKWMAAGHGVAIFVTTSGYAYSSNDGHTWNSLYLGISFADLKATDSGFLGLEYFRTPNGAFASRLHHTYDGLEWWVVQEKPGLADRMFVGPDRVLMWGLEVLALVSHDGAEWTDVTRPSQKVIRDVAYGQGRFLGVLWPSGFLTSRPVNQPRLQSISKTGTTIRLQAESSVAFVVEHTERLGKTWAVLSNITQNAGSIEFQEPSPSNAFFRLKPTAP